MNKIKNKTFMAVILALLLLQVTSCSSGGGGQGITGVNSNISQTTIDTARFTIKILWPESSKTARSLPDDTKSVNMNILLNDDIVLQKTFYRPETLETKETFELKPANYLLNFTAFNENGEILRKCEGNLELLSGENKSVDVNMGPKIYFITPPKGANCGDEVCINGDGFGSAQKSNHITFNNIVANNVSQWSNTKIICIIPEGAKTGEVKVTVDQYPSNAIIYTIFGDASIIVKGGLN